MQLAPPAHAGGGHALRQRFCRWPRGAGDHGQGFGHHQGHQIHEGAVVRIVPSPVRNGPWPHMTDPATGALLVARSAYAALHPPSSGARSLACQASRRSTLRQKRCMLRRITPEPRKVIDKRKALRCVATQGLHSSAGGARRGQRGRTLTVKPAVFPACAGRRPDGPVRPSAGPRRPPA